MINNKYLFLIYVYLFSTFSYSASFERCETNLKKGAKREQLNQSLSCLSSELGVLMKKIETLEKTRIPEGTVAAFTLERCPDGWERFYAAEGRMIVGLGNNNGNNKDKNGVKLSSRSLRAEGGEEKNVLREEQLPNHSHELTVETWRDSLANGNPGTPVIVSNLNLSGTRASNTALKVYSPDKKVKASNNMPPYIALKICLKK